MFSHIHRFESSKHKKKMRKLYKTPTWKRISILYLCIFEKKRLSLGNEDD